MCKGTKRPSGERVWGVLSLEEAFTYVFCMTSRYHIFSGNLVEIPFAKDAEKFVYDNLRA